MKAECILDISWKNEMFVEIKMREKVGNEIIDLFLKWYLLIIFLHTFCHRRRAALRIMEGKGTQWILSY